MPESLVTVTSPLLDRKHACSWDKFADIKDIKRYIEEERAKKNEQLIPFLTTSLKVDKETNMGLISDIKQELRKVEAYKINYTTRKATEDAQVFDNMN